MGTGSITYDAVSDRYLVDLSVTSRYLLTDDDLLLWEASFRYASQYLFNATKGKMQLNRIGLLAYSSVPTTDDVKLVDETVHSSAAFDYFRSPNQIDFSSTSRIKLTRIAQIKPLEITHELFHYVVGLADEYIDSTLGQCTGDAATGGCIMEFAADNSIQLEVSAGQVQVVPQSTLIEVTQLCFPASSGVNVRHHDRTSNYQQQVHCESCWNTLHKHYPQIPIPAAPTDLPQNSLNDLDWFLRQSKLRIALVVLGAIRLTEQKRFKAVKRALLAQLKLVAGNETEVAIFVDTTSPFRRELEPVPGPQDPSFNSLLESIRNLVAEPPQFPNNGSPPFSEIDFFDQDDVAAWQTLMLSVPNSLELGSDSELESVRDLARRLAFQFVDVRATVSGLGEFENRFGAEFQKVNPRYDASIHRLQDARWESLAFQGAMLESMVYQIPGMELISVRWGTMPQLEKRQRPLKKFDHPGAESQFRWHPLSDGYDTPFHVESGAEAIHVWVNQLFDVIRMEILDPDLKIVASNFDSNPAGDLDAIGWLRVDNPQPPGRWLLRLDRASDPARENQNLPFEVFIASVNPKLLTMAEVREMGNGRVQLKAAIEFDIEFLDFVLVVVTIYDASLYGDSVKPVNSVVLSRPVLAQFQPDSEIRIESEISTGQYQGSLTLDPGSYIAEFRFENSGTAVFANNHHQRLFESPKASLLPPIPAFSRVKRVHFQID